MAKYQQYDEYKDSGVEWLGEIPNHWEVNRHKYVASFLKGRNPTELSDDYVEGYFPYLSMDSLRGKSHSKFAPLVRGLFLAREGQPLIIWDGSNAGEFVLGKEGIVSSTMAAAFLNMQLDPQYYWYLCLCFEPEMRRHANGMGIPHVNGDELKNINLGVPAKLEQTQIASFLDHETAQIDTLIEKQQILIQLLKEKRQAVISHAVTKGLNPDAPMKDSGVEWLGEVPEHWSRKSLNYLIAHTVDNRGRTPPIVEEGIPMAEVSQVAGNGVYTSDNYSKFITQKSYEKFVRSDVQENDILFVTVGATFGKTCLVPPSPDFFIAQNVVGFRCVADVNPKFFMFLFSSSIFKEAVSATNKSSTIDNVKVSDLVKTRVVIPLYEEQEEIANHIFKVTDTYEALVTKAEQAIQLMQERRTALISAAVTGKIDVRGWVAPE